MTNLIIIRGLPGSGKSTLAESMFLNDPAISQWVEADMYFMGPDGYRFDQERLWDAHRWCQETARRALENGLSTIVSNTSTTLKELRPYLEMPHDTLRVIHCTKNYGSIHGVPDDVLKRMADRWQPFAGEETYPS